MNDKSWQIDFGRLSILLLPTFLRKPILGKFVRMLVSGVAYVHTSLINYREEVAYELSMNGQVCRLRALLNDVFDREARRIQIYDMERVASGVALWERECNMGKIIGSRGTGGVLLNCRGYDGIYVPDFEVVVPDGLVVDTTKMMALINSHKLAGKRYVITKLI